MQNKEKELDALNDLLQYQTPQTEELKNALYTGDIEKAYKKYAEIKVAGNNNDSNLDNRDVVSGGGAVDKKEENTGDNKGEDDAMLKRIEDLVSRLEAIEKEKEKIAKEKEDILLAKEEELKKERERAEQLKKQIEELSSLNNGSNGDIESEDVTQKDIIEKIKKLEILLKQGVSNKESEEIKEKISSLEAVLAEQKKTMEENAIKRQQEEQKNRVKKEIEDFIKEFPEYSDISDIDKYINEYKKFIGNIRALYNCGEEEAEGMVDKYLDGKMPELDKIKPDINLKKYVEVADLFRLKNGIGKDGQIIKDRFGNRVVYRTIKEAYLASKYEDIIKRKVEEARKQIIEELHRVSNAPVRIPEEKLVSNITDFDAGALRTLNPLNPQEQDILMSTLKKFGL